MEYVPLVLAAVAAAFSVLCFIFIMLMWRHYQKEMRELKAKANSLSGRLERMRQEPPRIRVPFEERLKNEYAKRGIPWATTGK